MGGTGLEQAENPRETGGSAAEWFRPWFHLAHDGDLGCLLDAWARLSGEQRSRLVSDLRAFH